MPATLTTLTDGIAPARLRRRPEPEEWSPNEILAHLRSCADVWGDCIATILAADGPTIRAVNPRTWIDQTGYPELEFRPSLAAFTRQRHDLLARHERSHILHIGRTIRALVQS